MQLQIVCQFLPPRKACSFPFLLWPREKRESLNVCLQTLFADVWFLMSLWKPVASWSWQTMSTPVVLVRITSFWVIFCSGILKREKIGVVIYGYPQSCKNSGRLCWKMFFSVTIFGFAKCTSEMLNFYSSCSVPQKPATCDLDVDWFKRFYPSL